MTRRIIKDALRGLGFDVKSVEKRRNIYATRPSWEYQAAYVLPHYKESDLVIDVGCGSAPSPPSSLVTDYYPDETIHRARPVAEDKPLVVCPADRMPFRTKYFDLSVCSHVLEHVPNPAQAAAEIARISKRGYLETPAYGKDTLIGTGHQHIWQVVNHDGTLHFFPYTERQHRANADSPLMTIWCQEEYHPWQKYFWERQDVFNAIQVWDGTISIRVHASDETAGRQEPAASWKAVASERLPPQAPNLSDAEISLLEECLVTPGGDAPMRYRNGDFVDPSGNVVYPVRGKRIYFELPDTSRSKG